MHVITVVEVVRARSAQGSSWGEGLGYVYKAASSSSANKSWSSDIKAALVLGGGGGEGVTDRSGGQITEQGSPPTSHPLCSVSNLEITSSWHYILTSVTLVLLDKSPVWPHLVTCWTFLLVIILPVKWQRVSWVSWKVVQEWECAKVSG